MSTEKPKPVVWIATPLREFPHDGILTPDIFETLDDHYKAPIRELGRHPELPWHFELMVVGGGGVARARNRIVSDFMAKTSHPEDSIFWVDYDLMPTLQDYLRILLRDLDICGGLYTVRAERGHWVLNKLPGAAPQADGLLQVMELGTGFKRMKRRTFEKVLAKNPWLDCESDFDHRKRELGFFSMGPVHDPKLWPGKHRWLTEDYWLDWLCRDADIPVVADTLVKLRHREQRENGSVKIYPAVFPEDPGALPAEAREA